MLAGMAHSSSYQCEDRHDLLYRPGVKLAYCVAEIGDSLVRSISFILDSNEKRHSERVNESGRGVKEEAVMEKWVASLTYLCISSVVSLEATVFF